MGLLNRRTFSLGLSAGLLVGSQARAQTVPGNDTRIGDHPNLAGALQYFNARNWRDLCNLVKALPPQSASSLIEYLGDISALDAPTIGLDREQGGATIAGGLFAKWAWRYRGSGPGATVTTDASVLFEQRLQTAKQDLESALAADPDDGVASAFLMRVHKGLGDLQGVDQAFHRFELARRPLIGGYAQYADAISGKWYGSQQRMLGFARQHKGSMLPQSQGLIAQAHNETMMAMGSEGGPNYFHADAVRAEIIAANDAFHAQPPDPDNFENRFAYGAFAFSFMEMNEPDLARPHVAGMGGTPADPWSRLTNGHEVLAQLRRALGLSDL